MMITAPGAITRSSRSRRAGGAFCARWRARWKACLAHVAREVDERVGERHAELLGLLDGGHEGADAVGVVALAQRVEGVAPRRRRARSGAARAASPRAAARRSDSATRPSAGRKAMPALTQTARMSRKSGRPRSIGLLAAAAGAVQPGVEAERRRGRAAASADSQLPESSANSARPSRARGSAPLRRGVALHGEPAGAPRGVDALAHASRAAAGLSSCRRLTSGAPAGPRRRSSTVAEALALARARCPARCSKRHARPWSRTITHAEDGHDVDAPWPSSP